ncbi:MAG: SoxR reducing system RseC family protein [Cocleimonas sp.]|nr:SoxR reducing system RseC family protein [Cocleimonas sp.]
MMIEEIGRVERVEAGYIWVSPMSSGGACGSCKSSNSCSTSLVATLFKGKATKTVRVGNTINAKMNDTVVLGLHPQGLLLGSAIIYLLPIVSLFVFAVLGQQFWGETTSIVMGFLGIMIGLLISKKIAQSTRMKVQLEVISLRIGSASDSIEFSNKSQNKML